MITAIIDEKGKEVYSFSQLEKSLVNTRQNLLVCRQRRYECIEAFLSPYGLKINTVGQDRKVQAQCRLFKLTAAVKTYQRLLAARRPKVFCRTWDQEGRSAALLLEKSINQQFEVMAMEKVFRQCVQDGLFAAGVLKTGVGEDGMIYCEVVDFDDVVFDTAANSFQSLRFLGNFYRVPVNEATALLGDKSANAQSQVQVHFENYDVKNLSTSIAPDTLEPEVEFLDIFLTRERLLVTFLARARTSYEVVKVQPYIGPETGPFNMLTFGEMPKSVIPMAPALEWRELSQAIDDITSKLFRQARRQKEVVVSNGEIDDLKRIGKAGDSDYISVAGNAREAAISMQLGGPNQQNFAFNITAQEWFNVLSGNLNVLAGLGTEAGTAHQEELLNANAGGMVDEMRDRVHAFARDISYKIGWYVWHSNMVIPVDIKSPSGMATVTHLWTPEQRTQSWDQFRFDIEPYSMVPQTPMSLSAQLNKTIAEVVMPLAGPLAQQGYIVDAAKIVAMTARLNNLPELDEIVVMNPAVAMMAQAQAQPGGAEPPPPPREYIRTSRSQPTTASKNAAIRAQAAGQNQQPKQQAQAAGQVA